MRFLGWLRPKRLEQPDWQLLVDNLALAAGIAWQSPPRKWVTPYQFAARTICDHYYAAILAGNLNVEDVDGEMFALEAALDEVERRDR